MLVPSPERMFEAKFLWKDIFENVKWIDSWRATNQVRSVSCGWRHILASIGASAKICDCITKGIYCTITSNNHIGDE